MIATRLIKALRRFARAENGSMTLEFAILFPVLFVQLLMAVEYGVWSVRQTYLERGLEMTVREIRLSTASAPTYEDVKDMICDHAGPIPDCGSTMRLEMRPTDPRNFQALPADADCIDRSEPIQPEREFSAGAPHQLMQMRACVKFDPVFPTIGLGFSMAKDGSGQAKLLASSAFVQEPE